MSKLHYGVPRRRVVTMGEAEVFPTGARDPKKAWGFELPTPSAVSPRIKAKENGESERAASAAARFRAELLKVPDFSPDVPVIEWKAGLVARVLDLEHHMIAAAANMRNDIRTKCRYPPRYRRGQTATSGWSSAVTFLSFAPPGDPQPVTAGPKNSELTSTNTFWSSGSRSSALDCGYSRRMRQGAPGVSCSPAMMPSLSQR